MRPLGLIAGEGVFPLLVARGARAAGRNVICVALAGSARPELEKECDRFRWVSPVRLSKWIRVLRGAGCAEAIMVGRVLKTRMYDRGRYFRYIPDLRSARLWLTKLRHNRSPRAILSALAEELQAEGITLIDSTRYTSDQLATPGVMTRCAPSESQWQDIRRGWEICRSISAMDIGQSIAILKGDVIAVEALEGTNAMIERAGNLCQVGGWTLIKVANAHQDMRMDVPTIGVTTIEKLSAARCSCVVMEAGKTVLLEKKKVLDVAERSGIAVVGYESA
jgi:UDP-2,3-diacylglucosamine hydrolase